MSLFNTSRSALLFLFLAAIFVGVLTSRAAWDFNHGLIFVLAGAVMLCSRAQVAASRYAWLAVAVVVLAMGAFLPAAWFGIPEWRRGFEAVGIEVGDLQVIQVRQAFELTLGLAATVAVGLWLTTQRCSSQALGFLALSFSALVAAYAVGCFVYREPLAVGMADGDFGIFPNRNHTSTLLSMGFITGLGCVVQAIRDKRWMLLLGGLLTTGVCLWAVLFWSISRSGVLLVGLGSVLLFAGLGVRYLGRHAVMAMVLIGATALAGFMLTDTRLKGRLMGTELVAESPAGETLSPNSAAELDSPPAVEFGALGLRLPLWKETASMIGDSPLVGVGMGQFAALFPQYQEQSVIKNDANVLHPENDWLWLAAELGVPALLMGLSFVVILGIDAFRKIRQGKLRGLRMACLIGALLLPIHGCIDVPGHRVPLFLAAAFLYMLSMTGEGLAAPEGWRSRVLPKLVGLLVTTLGACLLFHESFGLGPSAVATPQRVRLEAQALLERDKVLAEAARKSNLPYQPDPDDDLLELAIRLLLEAEKVSPLDRVNQRLTGQLALYFDDKYELVRSAYAKEAVLDPQWVLLSIDHATDWVPHDMEESKAAWREAYRRAQWIENKDPATRFGTDFVIGELRFRARRYPKQKAELEEFIPLLNPNEAK
ncbi:O-antigen ligase family protein [Haloferula chungangensis]|uniref:O-antigen ligase family protein n=1 Tax=Haloferula chungangensis TaxID=1048331 RepID=A0ABW2L8Q4_9BACT